MKFELPQFFENLWSKYGFKANPFDTSPLSLSNESYLPIVSAIVGRDFLSKESRTLYNILRSSGGGRVVIEGNLGVGKTTFVNYHRYLWENYSKNKLFTPQEEIAVTEGWRLIDFLQNILCALISKLYLLKGEKYIIDIPILREIFILTQIFYRQNFNLEGSFMGTGLGFSKSQNINVPLVSELQLLKYLQEIVKEIKRMGYIGVFLHIDNLELLNNRDINYVRTLFENIRDCLQIRDIYYVFVGNSGFFRDIIGSLPRVRSIFFGKPIVLPILTEIQVKEAIKKRYELLSIIKGKYILPVEEELIEHLYHIYSGNLRYILDALNMLICENEEYKTLKTENAKFILKALVKEQIESLLTPSEWEILSFFRDCEMVNNKLIAKHFKIQSSNVARSMNRLKELNLIYLKEKIGKNLYYVLSEYANLIDFKKNNKASKKLIYQSKTDKRLSLAIEKISKIKKIRHGEYSQIMQVSLATATRDLNELLKKGTIIRHGKGKNGYYELA